VTSTRKPLLRSAAETIAIVAVAIGLALGIQAYIVKPYEIPSRSMIPTLQQGQRILVDRIATHFVRPRIGDVYVFHPPASLTCSDPQEGINPFGEAQAAPCDVAGRRESSQTYVKRVVGLPGDRIAIVDGQVIRNGRPERGWRTEPCGDSAECNFRQAITVPPGDYYMMGDNRGDSLDSRYWGPVPRAWLIGQAFFTYWPPGRIGAL